MPRIIEIVLFLAPFAGFAVWRLVFPSPVPPLWLVGSLAAFVLVMVVSLVWLRHLDAGDASQTYVPAQLRNGLVVPAQRAAQP